MKLLSIFSTMLFFTKIITKDARFKKNDDDYSFIKMLGEKGRKKKAAIPKFGDTRTIKAICYEERCGSSTNYCSPEGSSC